MPQPSATETATPRARSRELLARAKQSLASGVSSAFRAKAVPHPLYFDRGQGSRIIDVDGNEYLDYTLAWGPLILGHAHPAVAAAVAETVVEDTAAETAARRLDAVAATSTTLLVTAITGVPDAASPDAASPDAASPDHPETTTTAVIATSGDFSGEQNDASPDARALQVLDVAEPLDGFDEGLLRVESSSGATVWPVIVAATSGSRSVGLMGVEDFEALGGYAAMVFVFDGDTTGAFWMRDTPLPLSITFVAVDGTVVSGTDMVPCLPPTPAGDCERYYADGPYRIAIEHPLGPEFDLGLRNAASVTLGQ